VGFYLFSNKIVAFNLLSHSILFFVSTFLYNQKWFDFEALDFIPH